MIDLSQYDEIIIWGASFPSNVGGSKNGGSMASLQKLLDVNGYWGRVICIVDDKDSFHGEKRFGIPVQSPLTILGHPKALIIINTISWFQAIQSAMKEMGIMNDYLIIPFYFCYGTLDHIYCKEDAKRYIEIHENEIRDLYYLEDDQTRRYLNIIFDELCKEEADLYTSDYYEGTGGRLDYFCDTELAPRGDVTYIDVGAYNGDSIEPVRKMYGKRVKKILAFEPDEVSRGRLDCYVRDMHIEDKVRVFPYALGDKNKTVRFSESGTTSIVSAQGTNVIEQKVFDELTCIDINGVIMVKMDIEGAELGALKGMRKLIEEKHPYLAICLYHKEQDLYEIAHYIKSVYSHYRLYLRGGWHLECWAVPQEHFSRF